MWDFFDGVYCINLPTRPERWEAALKQFATVGLDRHVIRADGVINEADTVLACKQAHMNVVRMAREKGHRNVLIFEDDVEFVCHDLECIQGILAQLKAVEDWGFCYLGSIPGMWKGQPIYGPVKGRLSENLLEVGGFYGAHAYALNAHVFDDVLERCVDYPEVDKFYVKHVAKKWKTLHVYPLLCKQAPGFSDIKKVKVRRHDSAAYLAEELAKLA